MEIWSCHNFKQLDLDENFKLLDDRSSVDWFISDGLCNNCKSVFEAMGCFFSFGFVKKLDLSLLLIISNEEPRKLK